MEKIKIITIGKTKECWLQEAWSLYCNRLKGRVEVDLVIAKDNEHLCRLTEKERALICLDETGTLYNSVAFAGRVRNALDKGGGRLTFVIGGDSGLPQELKERGSLVSLSPLTFTHQCVRLILIEQIYRSYEIFRNSPYHK